MKFRKVDKQEFTCYLLAKQNHRNKMEEFLKEVMASGNEISEVDWTSDYKSAKACCEMIYKKLKKMGIGLRVTMKKDHIYLVRTDME